MFRYSILIFAFLWVSVTARNSAVEQFIKLAFGASKAAYIPFQIARSSDRILEKNGPGYTLFCTVRGWNTKGYEERGTEVLLLKNPKQKLAVFAFRGTEAKLNDLIKTLKFRLIDVDLPGCKNSKLNEGFSERYRDISSWFEAQYQAIPSDYIIVMTGHSLGGAMATISAAYATGKLRRPPDAVITFASPMVGDGKFQKCYQDVVGCYHTIRITTRGDVGTVLPPGFRYAHVCKALLIGRFSWNIFFNHYRGYQQGLQDKYGSDMMPVNFGCDREI